jgi:hypothetical protein
MSRGRILLIALAWLGLLATPAMAAGGSVGLTQTGQPKGFIVQTTPYTVTGYGKFQFGMTPDEVRAEIAKEYPDSAASLKEATDPVDRTQGIAVVVNNLPIGDGSATLSFVFGYESQKLIAVTVTWLADGDPSADIRQGLLDGGSQLAANYIGYRWPAFATARGQMVKPGSVVLFSGKDAQGGGVEVRVDGVALDVEQPKDAAGKPMPPQHEDAPAGPARLRLSFVANVDKPDIYRVPAGLFIGSQKDAVTGELLITGFGNAHFGMSKPEVLAAINRDLRPAKGHVGDLQVPDSKASMLGVWLDVLEPAPGPANVAYVFGAATNRLYRVEVIWTLKDPTDDERQKIAVAGLQLSRYFQAQNWKPKGQTGGAATGENSALLFAGIDPKLAGVELTISGVKLESGDNAGPPPTGPAQLRLSYSVNLADPTKETVVRH